MFNFMSYDDTNFWRPMIFRSNEFGVCSAITYELIFQRWSKISIYAVEIAFADEIHSFFSLDGKYNDVLVLIYEMNWQRKDVKSIHQLKIIQFSIIFDLK